MRTTRHAHDLADIKLQIANTSGSDEDEAEEQKPHGEPISSYRHVQPPKTRTTNNDKRKEALKHLDKCLQIASDPLVQHANGTVTEGAEVGAADVFVTLDKPAFALRVGSETQVGPGARRADSTPFNASDRVRLWFEPSFCDKKVGQVVMIGHLWEEEGGEE